MSYDALQALQAAGMPIEALSDAQRSAVSSLSEEEVALVTRINRRVAEAGGGSDVEGHASVWGVGIF